MKGLAYERVWACEDGGEQVVYGTGSFLCSTIIVLFSLSIFSRIYISYNLSRVPSGDEKAEKLRHRHDTFTQPPAVLAVSPSSLLPSAQNTLPGSEGSKLSLRHWADTLGL